MTASLTNTSFHLRQLRGFKRSVATLLLKLKRLKLKSVACHDVYADGGLRSVCSRQWCRHSLYKVVSGTVCRKIIVLVLSGF
jgi:hypothetical protein